LKDAESSRHTVRGERDGVAVNRGRSVQSRVSSALALGLVSALGLGTLTWYYANAMLRQTRAREQARSESTSRAQGDVPLPPLGRVEGPAPATTPPDAPMEVAPGAPKQAGAPVTLAEAPAAEGFYANAPGPSSNTAPTPAQLAEARQLSGVAFAVETNGPGAAAGAVAPNPAASAPGPYAALPASPVADAPGAAAPGAAAPDFSALLRPTVTAAVRAQRLPGMRLLLPKGAFIDCTLETAIDSTLPGMTTCITATDTFGVDGKVVLLERGTKLVGEVRGQVEQGAARIFVLWSEARTPTGIIVPLASPGADELGRAGLPGEVNRHFWQRFGAAMLVSVIDGAVQTAVQSSSKDGGTVIYNPSGSQGVTTEVLKSTVNVPPTIVKPQGDRIAVLVARDLDFAAVYALRPLPAAH
jgi:type IV secretion system protein VirB10